MKQLIFIFPFHGQKKTGAPALLANQKLKSPGGFTIMEVALAATVLALTLVGMIQVIESGAEMLDLSRKQTIAAQILQDEIDQLRLMTWPQVTNLMAQPMPLDISGDSTFTTFAGQLNPGTVEIYPAFTNFPFTGTENVIVIEPPQPSANPPLLLQVTYTVKWTSGTGHQYIRTSTTYVGKNGLNVAYQRS